MNWHDLMDRIFETFPVFLIVTSWNRTIAMGYRDRPLRLWHANDDDPWGVA